MAVDSYAGMGRGALLRHCMQHCHAYVKATLGIGSVKFCAMDSGGAL